MSDYKCLLAGGPDSENSHDLLPKLMEPQTGTHVSVSSSATFPREEGPGPDTGLSVGM